jgi:hypothetical protein
MIKKIKNKIKNKKDTMIWNKHNFVLNDGKKTFFNMVDFTTAIILCHKKLKVSP